MNGISVVCTCAKRSDSLESWLQSLSGQTAANRIHAIIVSDISLAIPDCGVSVKVVKAPPFRGPFPEAWWKNIGVRSATTDLVATTNIDILYKPGFFDLVQGRCAPGKLVQAIRIDAPQGALVGSDGTCTAQCGMSLDLDEKLSEVLPITACGDLQAMDIRDWDRLSGFNEQLTGWGVLDVDLSARAIFSGMTLEYIGANEPFHIHKGHPSDSEKNGWDEARNRSVARRSLRTVGWRPNSSAWGTIQAGI